MKRLLFWLAAAAAIAGRGAAGYQHLPRGRRRPASTGPLAVRRGDITQ